MISPDYKLYHGTVLVDLLCSIEGGIHISEYRGEGRRCSYIIGSYVGIHIKHSTQRLEPWQFTFTKSNLIEISRLCKSCKDVFIIFVCRTDGLVCLSISELTLLLTAKQSDQAWIRVSRRKGKWYSVFGGAGELPYKKGKGIDQILSKLATYRVASE